MSARRSRGLRLDERTATWMLASVLLDYPGDELFARLPTLDRVAGRLPSVVADSLADVLTWIRDTPAREVAAEYVSTFDHTRRCCPYLTYYAYGDTRKRGLALLAVKNTYRAAGVVLKEGELPDHLAVVLEFAATADPAAGERLLIEHRAGVELLRLALVERASPYAGVLEAVSATLPALHGRDRDAVARLVAAGPPVEEVGLAYGREAMSWPR